MHTGALYAVREYHIVIKQFIAPSTLILPAANWRFTKFVCVRDVRVANTFAISWSEFDRRSAEVSMSWVAAAQRETQPKNNSGPVSGSKEL
jgi:hypothetical protein